jgi:hypothetical protein
VQNECVGREVIVGLVLLVMDALQLRCHSCSLVRGVKDDE